MRRSSLALVLVLIAGLWLAAHCDAVRAEEECVAACLGDDDGPQVTESECERWCEED